MKYFLAKKLFCVLMCGLVMLFTLPTAAIAAGEADWSGYQPISTKAELNAVRNNLSGRYYLTQDIVFTKADFAPGGAFYNNGAAWKPIGEVSSQPFTGTLDGNGYTIYNLQITAKTSAVGLFGYNNGTLRNLTIADGHVTLSGNTETQDRLSVGAIAGENKGTVTGCTNAGTSVEATATNSNLYVGGVVGYNAKGTLTYCLNRGSVTGQGTRTREDGSGYSFLVGGVVGEAQEGTFLFCGNEGAVNGQVISGTGRASVSIYTGGVAGRLQGSASGCRNLGQVTATVEVKEQGDGWAYAGGVVGRCQERSVLNSCYNVGAVTVNTQKGGIRFFAGGLVGFGSSASVITHGYNAGKIKADGTKSNDKPHVNCGGIVGGTSDGVLVSACYNVGALSCSGSVDAQRYMGGIVGDGSAMLSGCYYHNAVSRGVGSSTTSAAIACSEAELKRAEVLRELDFNLLWMFDEGQDYPYPQLRANPHQWVVSIRLSSAPREWVYLQGTPAVDVAGGRVEMQLANGTTKTVDLTANMVSGFDGSVLGTQVLTVTCEGQTTTFSVQVVADSRGLLGDVDGDSKVTSTDARLTLQYYANKITAKDLNLAVADVDGDGQYTSTDARLILQLYAGKIPAFPAK